MSTTTQDEPMNTIEGVCSTDRIMLELWERVSPDLSPDELRWFANATEYAGHMTSNLQDVVDGIGCLVDSDRGNKAGRSGSFQDGSVSQLLFNIGHQLETIEGLTHIGDSASYFLHNPRPKTISGGES